MMLDNITVWVEYTYAKADHSIPEKRCLRARVREHATDNDIAWVYGSDLLSPYTNKNVDCVIGNCLAQLAHLSNTVTFLFDPLLGEPHGRVYADGRFIRHTEAVAA